MNDRKLAILIDGDNAQASLIEQILNETGKFGRITIKRIYADWTIPQMSGWKEQLNKYAIKPVQKFSYSKGKNSTDTALIIDAMDVLHSKLVDGFCIVSSDSDFTGIAHRIREEGFFIMGIGRSDTPEAFVKACDNFTFTEILRPKTSGNINKKEQSKPDKSNSSKPKSQETKPVKKELPTNKITNKPIDLDLVDNAFEMVVDENTGHALLSKLGDAIRKIDPTFDPRSYGFQTFRKLCEALKDDYETYVHPDKQTISLKRKD